VLLGEDNAIDRQVAAEFLRRRGAVVALAEGERLPVVAMTAAVMNEDRQACSEAGMNDFVAKPVDGDELEWVLLRHLVPAGCESGVKVSPVGTALADDKLVAPLLPRAELVEMGEGALVLPGFDLAAALRRLDGNEALLGQLLAMLVSDNEGTAARLRVLIEAGEMDGAATLVHGVKGSAANVGAVALAGAAALEDALRSGVRQPSLGEFEELLAAARFGIAALPIVRSVVNEERVVDSAERAALLRAVQPLIVAHELLPDDLAARLEAWAANDARGLPGRLVRELSVFDHEAAGKMLAALIAAEGCASGFPPKA